MGVSVGAAPGTPPRRRPETAASSQRGGGSRGGIERGVESSAIRGASAWPAQPQDAYGLEKLASEEVYKHYQQDFGIQTRIGRFHNIYGPYGTWKGGREKAPAAFCRKAALAEGEIEMWGDGKQTRSFTYIDDCVEGILRLTKSDFGEPLNLGSDESKVPLQGIGIALDIDEINKLYNFGGE